MPTLKDALELVDAAQDCIRENSGKDKHLAREAFSQCVAESLAPALEEAIKDIDADEDILAIARFVQKRIDNA